MFATGQATFSPVLQVCFSNLSLQLQLHLGTIQPESEAIHSHTTIAKQLSSEYFQLFRHSTSSF
jgi:hypothetical protein